MVFRRTGRPRLAVPKKRQTTWEGSTISFTALTPGVPGFAIIFSEAIIENFGRPTLVRMRGQLLVAATVASASDSLGLVTMVDPNNPTGAIS